MDTGWEKEYRTHFDSIVAEYEKIRPEWVHGIYEDIFQYTKSMEGNKALEIGIGTGKATTPFLDVGYSIHWVDAAIGMPKALGFLKKSGAIALFRYNEVARVTDDLYQEIQKIHNQYYDRYYAIPYASPTRKTHADFYRPEEIYKGFRLKDLQSYGFEDVKMRFYDIQLEYSADAYIALLDTLSDHRNLPDAIRTPFYTQIKETIENGGGAYKVDYVFQLYLGRKPA